MTQELKPTSDFDKWFFTARDPEKDMPYGTHLIYRVCDNDDDKFEIGCWLLKVAFEAGYEMAYEASKGRCWMEEQGVEHCNDKDKK